MKNFKANIGKTIAVASGAVTIADLAQPVAPFAAYLMGASAIFCLILSFIKLIGREFGEGLTVSAYLGTGIFVMSSILYFYQASSQERMQKGLIASQISQFESLQYSLGMIDKKLVSIDENLTSIDRKVGDVKKETSQNPRKELANLGLTWTGKDFHSSIMGNDRETIEMYFRGGMQIDRNYDDGYSDKSILVDIIFKEPKGWDTTLEMAHAYGYDFNEVIFHYYGLGAKTIYNPPHYIALTQNRYDMADKLASLGADTDYSRSKIEALLAQEEKYASREVSDCTIQKKNLKTDYDHMKAQNKQYECQVAADRINVKVNKAKRNVAKYKEMLSHI
ncbi:hypothetical protein VCHA43P277_160021 [Vibrio chagasii]|nr:hypothetical protein VCHA34P126_140023 [Vibrio chagasii]CAH6977592.1 hypothetical protein VCHA43P277_160021 [Vibrio chagasii]CAH7026384.1 hypothetical protein VCHA41O247_160022 [Vibrio chagasii]CAH7248895.1 hypothetical protein VCHA50P420_160107 [Vibrio chagasii]